MSVEVAGNQLSIRSVNGMALVRCLLASPGMSRAGLSLALGLTRSTVTRHVRELLAEGWLVERDVVARDDRGRRPTPLFIDPNRLLLLGAEIGVGTVRVLGLSLEGEVRTRSMASFDEGSGPAACVRALASALLEASERADEPQRRIVGIGVGLPGGVDDTRGFLHFAPNLGWRNVPFGELLRRRLSATSLAGIPLLLRNEADVAAVGEIEFNPSQGESPLLYLSINRGLGAGMVVHDRLLTGRRGFAGEVGHFVLEVDGPPCSCGRRGCAETLINARARRGDEQGVLEAGRYLGVLLQNLAAVFDPGCMVLGGELVALGDSFLGPALDTLRRYTDAAHLPAVRVRLCSFGEDAVAVGAAGFARHCLTRPGAPAGLPAPGSKQVHVPLHRFQRLTPDPWPLPEARSDSHLHGGAAPPNP